MDTELRQAYLGDISNSCAAQKLSSVAEFFPSHTAKKNYAFSQQQRLKMGQPFQHVLATKTDKNDRQTNKGKQEAKKFTN